MPDNQFRKNFNSKSIGAEAEKLASEYLLKIGYKIIKKNFRFGKGEIDIIAEDGDILVFIEVKYRRNMEKGDPLLAITQSKIKQLKKIAEGYYFINKIKSRDCRFDVISLLGDLNQNPEIYHIKTAFY